MGLSARLRPVRSGVPGQPASSGGADYDAFVSYSHAADGQLAPALQAGLQGLGKPWYRRRVLRVFRDKTSLSASPELWPSIERALDASRHFVLLASPEAARSRWVDQEVGWWLEHRSPATMLIGLTGGELAWDNARGAFDPARSTALPPAALDWPGEEPLWVDLRWAHEARHVSLRDPRFREVVADLAAPVRGLPKDELIGEDIRQHRRTLRLARGAVAALLALAVAASASAVVAVRRADEARRQERTATSRLLAAAARNELEGRLDRALLLGAEALRLGQTGESRDALVAALQHDARRRTYLWPKARVDAVAFSPDGHLLASSGLDGNHLEGPFPVTVTDLRSRRQVATLSRRARTRGMAFSPNGKLLALADDSRAHDAVTFWDTSTWQQQGAPLQVSGADSVSFSKDGRLLAVNAYEATSVWDVAARRQLGVLPASERRAPGDAALAMSPDARLLAVSDVGTIRLWSLRKGRPASPSPLATFRPQRFPEPRLVTRLAFSPDGKLLAAGAMNGAVTVLDVVSHSMVTSFRAHARGRTWGSESNVTGLVFRRDGRTLLSAGLDGSIRGWDARSGKPIGRLLRGHEGGVGALALAPDGQALASGGVDERIAIWDLEQADGLGDPAPSAPTLAGLRLTTQDEGLNIPRPTHEYARTPVHLGDPGIERAQSCGALQARPRQDSVEQCRSGPCTHRDAQVDVTGAGGHQSSKAVRQRLDIDSLPPQPVNQVLRQRPAVWFTRPDVHVESATTLSERPEQHHVLGIAGVRDDVELRRPVASHASPLLGSTIVGAKTSAAMPSVRAVWVARPVPKQRVVGLLELAGRGRRSCLCVGCRLGASVPAHWARRKGG
jgi:WD40 repeat protein